MNPAALLDFLQDLSSHNERDWFQANKATYDQLRADFELDVAYWLRELAKDEPALSALEPKKCIFRIYRDVRFSKVKVPYKTHFSAYFAAGGKASIAPGRYVQIGANGQTMIGGGLYEPTKEQLAAVRQEIDYQADDLHLRNKSYWLGHEMADKQVRSLSPDAFRTQVLDALRALSPFCDWLREATPAAG
jgi:uncharacterized protein (TIGR02453 family)